jgi:hypothetical protein
LIDPIEFNNSLNNLGLNSQSISVGQTMLIDEVGIYQLILFVRTFFLLSVNMVCTWLVKKINQMKKFY